jgi:hypothetical protein
MPIDVGRAIRSLIYYWNCFHALRCSTLPVRSMISWVLLSLLFTKSGNFASAQKWVHLCNHTGMESCTRFYWVRIFCKWVRLCNCTGLDTEASVPTGWTFLMLLVWIAMVSPTTLIPISACSMPNFNTVIHNNGKKWCSHSKFISCFKLNLLDFNFVITCYEYVVYI